MGLWGTSPGARARSTGAPSHAWLPTGGAARTRCALPYWCGCPEPEGSKQKAQAAELSRDVPSDYAYSWLEDLRARVGFAAFRDSLGQHFDGGSPVHQHVVEYTVELVAADLIYNMLLRAANPVHPAVAERLQRRAVASFIKHPAWCPAHGGFQHAQRRAYKVYRRGGFGILGKEDFRPQTAMMSVSRAAVYDQWAAIIGVLSEHYLKPVVESILQLARLGGSDPLSMVLLSACRYVVWSTLSPVETLALRQFLRFNIGLVDNFRGTNERLLHINLFVSVLKHADCTRINQNHDAMSLFKNEVMDVYNMATRWSKQDGLHGSSSLLLSMILAICPTHAMMHLQGFFSKKILKMLRRKDQAEIAARCLVVIMQGRHIPRAWGWRVQLPCAGAGGGVSLDGVEGFAPRHAEPWRPWGSDAGRAFTCVAREDESRESREGRVTQIWETILQCSKDGSLTIKPRSVEVLVALLVQSAAQSLAYKIDDVLPRLLSGGCEKDSAPGAGYELWKFVALRAVRTMLDPCSGFIEYASQNPAAVQAAHTLHGKRFRDTLHDLVFKLADAVAEVAIEVNRTLKTEDVQRELRPFPPQILNPYHEVRGIVENSYDVVFEVMIAAQYSGRALKIVKALQSALVIKHKSSLQYTSSSVIRVIGSDTTALANLWRLDFCHPPLSELGLKPVPVASNQNPPCTLPDEGVTLLREIAFLLPFLDPVAASGSAPGGEGFMGELLLRPSEDLRQAVSAVLQALAREHPHTIGSLLASLGKLLPLCSQEATGDIFYLLAHMGIIVEAWTEILRSESLPAAFLLESGPVSDLQALVVTYMACPSQNVRRMALQVLQLCQALLQRQRPDVEDSPQSLAEIFESGGDDIVIRAALRMLREKHSGVDLDGEGALDALTMRRFTLQQLAEGPCKGHQCWELPASKRHEEGTVCENETELCVNAQIELGLHLGENLPQAAAVRSHASYLSVEVLRNFEASAERSKSHRCDWVNLLSFFVSLHVAAIAQPRGATREMSEDEADAEGSGAQSAVRDVKWVLSHEASHRDCFACLAGQTREKLKPQLQAWRGNFVSEQSHLKREAGGSGGDRLDLMGKRVKNHTQNTPYIPADFRRTADSEVVLLELQEFLDSGVLFHPFVPRVSNVREPCSKVLGSIHWSVVEAALLSLRRWSHTTAGSSGGALEALDKILSNYDLRYSLALKPGIVKFVSDFLTTFEPLIFQNSKEMVARLKRGDSSLFVTLMSNPATQSYIHAYASVFQSLCGASRAVGVAWDLGFLTHVFHLMYGCFSAQKKIAADLVTMPTDSRLVVGQQALHAVLNAMGDTELADIKKSAYFRDAPAGGFGESVMLQLKEDDDHSYFQDLARKACAEDEKSKQFFETIYQYIVPTSSQGSVHQLMATDADAAERVARHGPLILAVGILHLTSQDRRVKAAAVEILVFSENTLNMMFSSTVEQDTGFLEIQASMVLSEGGTVASRAHCFRFLREVAKRCIALTPEVVIQMAHVATSLTRSSHSNLDWFLESLGPWLRQADLEAFEQKVERAGIFNNLTGSRGAAFEILHVLHAAFSSAEERRQERHGEERDSLFCTWTNFLSNPETRQSNAPLLLGYVLECFQTAKNATSCPLIATSLYRECPDLTVHALLGSLREVLKLPKVCKGAFGESHAEAATAVHRCYKVSAAAAAMLSQPLCEPDSLQECRALPTLLCFGILLCDADTDTLRKAARELLASAIACPKPLKSSSPEELEGRRREQLSANKLCSDLRNSYTATVALCGAVSNSKGVRNMQVLVSIIARYVGPCSTSLARELSQELLKWSLDTPTTQLSTRAVQAYMHCRPRLQAKDVHTVLQLLVRKFVINSSRWPSRPSLSGHRGSTWPSAF